MIYGTIYGGPWCAPGPAASAVPWGSRGARPPPGPHGDRGTGAVPGVLVPRGCWGINKSHFWGC